MLIETRKSERIRALNDSFRSTFHGGQVMFTSGFNSLSAAVKIDAINKLKTFSAFEQANNPHEEHDFISLEAANHRIFAKIDYYDRDIRYGADDPSDPERTVRIMTVMLADEY